MQHPATQFGPIAPSRLALMGVRFIDGEDGATPPAEPAGQTTPPVTPEAPKPGPPPAPAEVATPPAAEGDTPPAAPGESVEALPAWAQREIREARNEARNIRNRAKDEAAAAAAQARADVTQSIGKALGLVPDETTDPEALLTAAQRAAATAAEEARQSKVALSVYRTADHLSADPDALLDSLAFREKVGELDPTAEDFSARVADIVQKEVEANPSKFRKAPPVVPANSNGAPITGAPPKGADDIEDFRRRYRENRGLTA